MLRILLVSIAFALLSTVASATAYASPTDTVRGTVDAVVETLADAGLDEDSKRSRVTELITERFNFPVMSQRILATNWKKANDDQRARFIGLFTRILANTYWLRIKEYSEQTVEYAGEKIKNKKTARVNTVILSGNKKIPVDYSLYLKGEQWFAYDVAIEGVSLVSTYRSSYQQIAKQEGIEGLLAKMEQKLAESGVQ